MGQADRQSDLLMGETHADDNSSNVRSFLASKCIDKPVSKGPADRCESPRLNHPPGDHAECGPNLVTFEILLIVFGLAAGVVHVLHSTSYSSANASTLREPLPVHLSPVINEESRLSPETLAVSLSSGVIALYILSCRWICCRFLKLAQELED